ncbi:MAG: aminoacyl-tRNA hydrolase [Phycisphaerae bacterium]|nr:aminoacyl-tRNA hydrolase [Phycisphaerae bacterium]HBZ97633.1 aminoacyl-tRNA hydrolase [Phycisphaerales bacterium]
MIEITRSLQIPESELRMECTRGTGPGGQNVNKVETCVTLCFDVAQSASLRPEQRDRIREVLASRITSDGVLRITSRKHRTQLANRRAVQERFVELLRTALTPRKKRRPTRATKASKERRLKTKRQRGDIKKGRGGSWD